jgi:hypothetical protein
MLALADRAKPLFNEAQLGNVGLTLMDHSGPATESRLTVALVPRFVHPTFIAATLTPLGDPRSARLL